MGKPHEKALKSNRKDSKRRKQGYRFLFHLPTVKSVKAIAVYVRFVFQNSNTVTVRLE